MNAAIRRVRDLVRALGALLAIAAIVVGVPALLLVTVGNPLPETIPTIDEIRVVLTQSGDGFAQFVLSALAVLIWFLWLQLVLALFVEIVATARKRPTPRLPTAPGIQAFAARLIATITLAATLAATPLAPALGALSFDGFESSPVAQSQVQSHVPGSVAASLATNWSAESETSVSDGHDHGEVHRVTLAQRTELWDLAEAAFGDGTGWKTILTANLGEMTSEGTVIDDATDSLPAGTSVAIPGSVDVVAVRLLGSSHAGSQPAAVTSVEGSTSVEPARHTVADGESMWSIAQDRVGDNAVSNDVAEYWGQIVADNSDVASGDVDLIYPGEELVLPSVGLEDQMTELQVVDGPIDHGNVTEGDDSETTTSAEVVDAPHVADGTESAGVVDTADAPSAEQTVEPALSATEPPADRANSEPVDEIDEIDEIDENTASVVHPIAGLRSSLALTPEQLPKPSPMLAADVSGSANDDDRGAGIPIAIAGLGTALIAAGIVGALGRRRALQWRMREPGTLPLQPTSEAAAFEAVLAHAAAQVSESTLGNNWQALPVAALAPVQTAAQVHAYADGRLRVVPLDRDDATDQSEQTAAVIDLRTEDSTEPSAAEDPSLDEPEIAVWSPEPDDLPVTSSVSIVVGTDASDGSAVLVDLAAGARIDLAGDHQEVCRFARSVVVDLATSDRSNDVQVIVVGHAVDAIDLERVQVTGTYQDALKVVARSAHAGGDSGTPVVIVATSDDDDDSQVSEPGVERSETFEELRSLGAIVAAPAMPDPDIRLTVGSADVMVWPSGTIAQTAALPDHGYRLVSELVDTTGLSAVQPGGTTDINLDVPQADGCSIEPGPVEVRVLGPVEVAGASAFSSIKAVDVVTYLAFHRNGVDADQLKTWVWPSFEPPTDKAFANVLSRARTGLGVDGEGSPYLSRAGSDRTYRLDEAVTTDFDRFRGLVDLADQCADQRHELDMLRQALELIRGVPFTGGTTSSFAWADSYVRAHVEFAIDEAVHRCADLALELGELATARWAALKGLELVPGCEQCFRRRFLVARAANNRQELRRAMADLERTTAAELGEPEAIDLISSDLLALFDELDRGLMSGAS